MKRRDRTPRLVDNTFVVGLVLLGVAAVVLWLAFQAQTGLPWEPTRRVVVEVPDAGKLIRNAEVRIGGARVGQVLTMRAIPRRGDTPPHARLDVQLDAAHGELPVDTTSEVRLASVLGGKYLSLVPGKSERIVPDGGRLPLANSVSGVDIEDALAVFDPEGRAALRKVIGELGDALAGRGADLHTTIGDTAALLPGLQRLLESLAAERTELRGFVAGLAAGTGALAPVAEELALAVRGADITFGAVDAAAPALSETIAELPALGRETSAALGTLTPVLADAAAIADALRPAGRELGPTMKEVDATLRVATRVDPRLGALAKPTDDVLAAVDRFSATPSSSNALRLLGTADLATFGTSAFVGLGAILAAAWDAEKHCASTSSWMRHLRDVSSDGDEGGNWIRMIPFFEENEGLPSGPPGPRLHANPYPNQDAQECEAGNEPWAPGRMIGNPPGLQKAPAR